MTTTSHFLTMVTTWARSAGTLSLLLAAVADAAAAVKNDDEDFNAIARKERDPYRINDIRLGYSMLPAMSDASIMDKSDPYNPANYRRETNWDKTGRASLMWMTPWSGVSENGDFILGVELSTNHCIIEASNVNPELDLRSYQVTVHPGMGWLLDDNFHVEINPFVGIGQAQYKLNIAGDGSAIYWEVGLRLGAYYTWNNGFQLGMQTAYMYGKTSGDLQGNGATYDAEIELQGISLGLQVGYRL